MKTSPASPLSGSPLFVTTHWSVVSLAREKDSPKAVAALEELCRAYWFPLYAYVRRLGHAPHDAQDFTQGFFACLLEKGYLDAADPEKGRFRTFLLVALKRFLANEWDKLRAIKRGGGITLVPLDVALAEERYAAALPDVVAADHDYERQWALTLLERTLAQLRQEYEQAGRGSEFDRLKEYLTADRGTIPYAEIAAALGIGEGGARGAVHRLRKRFRELFRQAVSSTVASPGEIEDEMRHLVRVLSLAQ